MTVCYSASRHEPTPLLRSPEFGLCRLTPEQIAFLLLNRHRNARLDKATVYRVALAYEQATAWHKKHATLA